MTTPEPSPRAAGEPGGPTTVELSIEGMHCGSCVALVEEALTEQTGVAAASVDLDRARAVVGFDPAAVGVDELRAAVEAVGYAAAPIG
jgi:copper chaperone CopZ